jgi:hypothetical protein
LSRRVLTWSRQREKITSLLNPFSPSPPLTKHHAGDQQVRARGCWLNSKGYSSWCCPYSCKPLHTSSPTSQQRARERKEGRRRQPCESVVHGKGRAHICHPSLIAIAAKGGEGDVILHRWCPWLFGHTGHAVGS